MEVLRKLIEYSAKNRCLTSMEASLEALEDKRIGKSDPLYPRVQAVAVVTELERARESLDAWNVLLEHLDNFLAYPGFKDAAAGQEMRKRIMRQSAIMTLAEEVEQAKASSADGSWKAEDVDVSTYLSAVETIAAVGVASGGDEGETQIEVLQIADHKMHDDMKDVFLDGGGERLSKAKISYLLQTYNYERFATELKEWVKCKESTVLGRPSLESEDMVLAPQPPPRDAALRAPWADKEELARSDKEWNKKSYALAGVVPTAGPLDSPAAASKAKTPPQVHALQESRKGLANRMSATKDPLEEAKRAVARSSASKPKSKPKPKAKASGRGGGVLGRIAEESAPVGGGARMLGKKRSATQITFDTPEDNIEDSDMEPTPTKRPRNVLQSSSLNFNAAAVRSGRFDARSIPDGGDYFMPAPPVRAKGKGKGSGKGGGPQPPAPDTDGELARHRAQRDMLMMGVGRGTGASPSTARRGHAAPKAKRAKLKAPKAKSPAKLKQEKLTAAAIASGDGGGGSKKHAGGGSKKQAPSVRRKKRWTTEEMMNLIQGVEQLGTGNWAVIRTAYDFDDRSNVDLKDKWRNMSDKYKREQVYF